MKRIVTCAVIVFAMAVCAYAQAGLTGKWQGKTRNGFQIALDLTATRTDLTGTLTYNGQASKIVEGKVSANTFTFKAVLDDRLEGFNGELDGDRITFWPDRMGRPNAVILMRAE